jgi:DNA polymerase-3 subunit beta
MIDKSSFLKSWALAERAVGTSSTMNILSGVLVRADAQGVRLLATDLKTSVMVRAKGADVEEGGMTVLPLRVVGDLLKKAPGSPIRLTVEEGKGRLESGRSKTRFSTYAVEEFPRLPESGGAEMFGVLPAGDLADLIERGGMTSSTNDDYPLYLSSVYFHREQGCLKAASTDSRRLAVARSVLAEGSDGGSFLLHGKAVRELLRAVGSFDRSEEVTILLDDVQAYFRTESVEFAVRRVSSNFPDYGKILPVGCTTWAVTDKGALQDAVERVDVVVRDSNKTVVMTFSPGGGVLLTGRAQGVGEAAEEIDAQVDGEPLRIACNIRFLMEGIKPLPGAVRLEFNGPEGQIQVKPAESDDYLALIAPISLGEEEASEPGEDAL